MGAAIRGPAGLIDLGAEPLTIGRSRTNRLVLTNSQISSKHAEIQPLAGGRYQVIDVGSTNGTSVNGVKLNAGQPQVLNPGDAIALGGQGGVELHFEASAAVPWQADQPQAAASPGAVPPAQPFGGGIGLPPPDAAGFPPAPGGFGPPGQPGPGPQSFPPPQEAFPAQPGGFPPPNQFGPPPGQPGLAPGFPPPGGPGAAPFGAPPAQGPAWPPLGAPAPFGAPGAPPPGGFPPGGPGPAAFGAPGRPAPASFAPPGGAVPVKKRTGRTLFLLAGSIIVVVLIIVGVVFALGLNKKSPTPTPGATSTPGRTPTATPHRAEHGATPSAAVASPMLVSAEGADGQQTQAGVVIRIASSVAVAVVSEA